MNFLELQEEIKRRDERREEIRRAVDAYAAKVFGIKSFSALADNMSGGKRQEVKLCLARQIPTPNIEHTALALFSEWLNGINQGGLKFMPLFLGFKRDSFCGKNDYKKSLVDIPELKRRTRGEGWVCQNRKVLGKEERRDLDGKIFSCLKVLTGEKLSNFHARLLSEALTWGGFSEYLHFDASHFFGSCLHQCLNNGSERKPSAFFLKQDDREVKIFLPGWQETMKFNLRPSADWFYNLHLLLFVGGGRVLLSTVGDCYEVEQWFKRASEELEREIGLKPLIINTPVTIEAAGRKSNLLEVNQGVFENGWRQRITVPPLDPQADLFATFAHLGKEVLEL